MTIANVSDNLNTYLYSNLKQDLERVHSEALAEISISQDEENLKPISKVDYHEVNDEYAPSIKPRVEVTLEERMEQVISPEEVKVLLSLLMRSPRISPTLGQLVDVKG